MINRFLMHVSGTSEKDKTQTTQGLESKFKYH